MPFSFKPDISPTAEPGTTPAPSASFGNASLSPTPTSMAGREETHGMSLVDMILWAAFSIAATIGVGLFVYNYYLNSQIDTKKATLASYESRLATLPLEDMRRLSNRIKIINQLILEHPSTNVAFRIIEDSVENQVTYKRFELRYNDSTKAYALQLSGVAPDYKSIAQQIDTFKRKPYVTYMPTVTVDSLQPDTTGKVGFTLKMPITIMGLQPEGLNLSTGAAERMGTSTTTTVGTTTPVGKATTTPVSVGTSTQPKATTTPAQR